MVATKRGLRLLQPVEFVPVAPLPTAQTGALALEAEREATEATEQLDILHDSLQVLGKQLRAASRADAYKGREVGVYAKLVGEFNDLATTVQAKKRRATTLRRQDELADHWQARRTYWTAVLGQEYGALGPQYTILVQTLVDATVRYEQLIVEGDVAAPEWRKASTELTALIGQLQKYTESKKTEIVKEAEQAAVHATVQFFASVIGVEAPDLWDKAVKMLRDRVIEGTVA